MTATITDDERAFIASIIAKPADDSPRLVYADWLEENDVSPHNCGQCKNGQIYTGMDGMKWIPCMRCTKGNGYAERAEFIRVQLEAEKLRNRKDSIGRKIGHTNAAKIKQNNARQLAIISGAEWNVPAFGWGWSTGEYKILQPNDPRRIPVVVWRRGFISEVRCTEEQWVGGECKACGGSGLNGVADGTGWCPNCNGGHIPGIGQRIAQTHPVERVVVTDKRPSEQVGVWMLGDASCTTGPDEARLAKEVFRLLEGGLEVSPGVLGFPTQKAALDAYSRAAIEWARRQTCVGGYHVATTEDACTTTSL